MGTQTRIGSGYGIIVPDRIITQMEKSDNEAYDIESFLENNYPKLVDERAGNLWSEPGTALIFIKESVVESGTLLDEYNPLILTSLNPSALEELNTLIKRFKINSAPKWYIWGTIG